MSRPVRPSHGSQPTVAGRMIPPMGVAGPTPVPHAYGFVAGQPHYLPHPSFPQNFPNVPNRMPLVSAVPGVPGMYVPVTQMNPGVRTPNVDPTKLLEEQRKLEKERNFQLQQQRLKQFTIAGKKGSMNAESLIDSMFGKAQPKQSSLPSNIPAKPVGTIMNEPLKSSNPCSESVQASPFNMNKVETYPSAPFKQEKKDKKELDAMMLECSDLRGPQKANKFSKPVVKELAPSAQQKYTFASSNKARDWSNLQGLDKVFVTRPRFPEWCHKENVPELYRQIEAIVTNNGMHAPDTKLLFPILISSGLPQPALGQIWELVNQSAPGHLTLEEMYAALALIAVTQAGHPVKTADILHQLPACPIPQLQCFANPPPPAEDIPPVDSYPPGETVPPQPSTHQVVRPSAISLKDTNFPAVAISAPETVTDNRTTSRPAAASGSGFISSPDDEFDDFKSATPTAVNFSMHTPSLDSLPAEDEFADFQQASTIATSASSAPLGAEHPAEQDLMSPDEDKYSVFRSLQQNEDTNEWGDFSNSTVSQETFNQPEEVDSTVKTEPTEMKPHFTTQGPIGGLFNLNAPVAEKEDNDFGDFLQAEVAPISNLTTKFESLDSNFADFSNFKEVETNPAPSIGLPDSSRLDDEFGDFTSGLPPIVKPELGHEFLFHHVRDNISLAETQSVSSLELGTFDGGGHSGESKSSLSRQGSIPSLDLKSTYLEGADNDEFGEFQTQSFVQRASKSPSPASDIKPPESNNSSNSATLALPIQSSRTVPLADKYSVIRAEQRQEEDQHISCWVRCLQSSVDILENTKRIFNQMSCSSVCNEVLHTEEGENYIKDVIEVYKVVRRISTASKCAGKQTIPMLDLLKEADQMWSTISGFFAGSALMPTEATFEFSSSVLSKDSEGNTKACGLCLLNVETKSKSNNNRVENLILSYGGRNYHSPCANLWVNCVDPLLPALTLPQLL